MVFGGEFTDSAMCNCYNVGNIEAWTAVYGLTRLGTVKNSYNLGNLSSDNGECVIYSIGGKSDLNENCHELTGNEDPETVLNALNNNREETWSEWVIAGGKNNGYPIFSWEQ